MIGFFYKAKRPCVIATLLIGFVISGSSTADSGAFLKGSFLGFNSAELALPKILTSGDTSLYQRIFDVQVSGNWKQADTLIADLSDR